MSEQQEYRIEHDSLGEVRVPAAALWRAQTQRAVGTSRSAGRPESSHVHALALIKGAAAKVNGELEVITQEQGEAIATAARRIADGEYDDRFPIASSRPGRAPVPT